MGPSFGNYVNSIANGFRCNGCDVTELPYVDPPQTPVQRALWRMLPSMGIDSFPRREIARLLLKVKGSCESADLLVIIKGDRLPLDVFEELTASVKCPVVLWFMDSVENVSDGLERGRLSSFLLYFEKSDMSLFRQHDIPAVQVDLAADPRWYFPVESSKNACDVSFLGTFYKERLEFLDHLVRSLISDGTTFDIMGQYIAALKPWRVLRFRKVYPSLSKVIHHVQMATHETINLLNNRSKICLNIMRKESSNSLNLRVFELCASGSFQLVMAHPALERCFEIGSEIEVFDCVEEAVEKIRFFQNNSKARERIARAGLERVRSEHTMAIRVAEVVEILRNNSLL